MQWGLTRLALQAARRIFEAPNPPESILGEVLEAFLGSPEQSWAVLARLGRVWVVLWVRHGVPKIVQALENPPQTCPKPTPNPRKIDKTKQLKKHGFWKRNFDDFHEF